MGRGGWAGRDGLEIDVYTILACLYYTPGSGDNFCEIEFDLLNDQIITAYLLSLTLMSAQYSKVVTTSWTYSSLTRINIYTFGILFVYHAIDVVVCHVTIVAAGKGCRRNFGLW